MAIDVVSQTILVLVTAIIGLIISYGFFDNSFNYFLYFELIFLTLFVGIEVIESYYLAVVLFILAIVIYKAIEPQLKEREANT